MNLYPHAALAGALVLCASAGFGADTQKMMWRIDNQSSVAVKISAYDAHLGTRSTVEITGAKPNDSDDLDNDDSLGPRSFRVPARTVLPMEVVMNIDDKDKDYPLTLEVWDGISPYIVWLSFSDRSGLVNRVSYKLSPNYPFNPGNLRFNKTTKTLTLAGPLYSHVVASGR